MLEAAVLTLGVNRLVIDLRLKDYELNNFYLF